ncbi:MAG: SDR family oxidoreductase [Gammaproteobacteria bacterium]|nr:SDR family oxidoreductase [Gammaproteobacteria bacterium]
MLSSISTRPLALVALLTVLTSLALPDSSFAGGHNKAPKTKKPVQLDPTLRSDITGTVLITGANRGIGLQLATNYAKRGWTVIATARKPKKADDLNALAKAHENVSVEYMDLLDHKGIDKLANKLKDIPIDVLLNNAAMLGDPAEQDFGTLDYKLMQQIYAVNTVGTMKMSEAFFEHVAASEQKKIVAITSLQASIGAMREPLIPFYKMSKTALNMGMKSTSKRVKRKKVTVALISPGAVDTRMMNSALDHAGVKGNFLITPQESAEAVINIIDQYNLKMTGTFMSHRGDVIPW